MMNQIAEQNEEIIDLYDVVPYVHNNDTLCFDNVDIVSDLIFAPPEKVVEWTSEPKMPDMPEIDGTGFTDDIYEVTIPSAEPPDMEEEMILVPTMDFWIWQAMSAGTPDELLNNLSNR